METYEDVKAKADKEIERLQQCIRDVKKTYKYDFKCPQCNEVKQFRVTIARMGAKGRVYCSDKCRSHAYKNREKAKTDNIIQGLKDRIEELESTRMEADHE
jgi:transcription elongation factor Elf1